MRPLLFCRQMTDAEISIHAPRAGCDSERLQKNKPVSVSLSQHRFVFVLCRQTVTHKDVFFSVRSSREIHERFGFALQIMSTPSGS